MRKIAAIGELTAAAREVFGFDCDVTGCSRTDSGVHARGNVAVFDTESRIPSDRLSYALNTQLPEDILVQNVGSTLLAI